MTYSKCIYLVAFILFTTISFAQKLGTIKSTLINQQNEHISYATIALNNSVDSLIQGTISDEKGYFELEDIAYGSYTLNISFIGYENKEINLDLIKQNLKLKPIILSTSRNLMDEVTVTAERSSYTMKLDKKIFRVGKDLLSQGTSTIDILDQVPLVSVSPSGSILLRGSSQVQILINGKRSGLTMNNAIDQIPSDNIDRIEVITNPSASFDAAGSAGIINIILKKETGMGLNGQLRLTSGSPANHIIQPGINFKTQKLNLFSNIRYRYSDYIGTYLSNQRIKENSKTFYSDKTENENRHDDGLSFYGGIDYYPNKNSSFTTAFFRANTKDSDITRLRYDNKEDDLISTINRMGNSLEHRNYNQLEANYTYRFAERSKQWSMDLQYDFWNSTKEWDLSTAADILPLNVPSKLTTNNIAGSNDFMIKSDFVTPLSNNMKIKTGIKYENRKVNNEYIAKKQVAKEWQVFHGTDNNINYGEQIAAAYIEYSQSLNSFEYQIGLRAESTSLDISDSKHIFTDDSKYIDLFPSLFLSYKISESRSLQTNYSRRINRPSLWSLYPFFSIKDINEQYVGNPNLSSSYTNGYELTLVQLWEKITLSPSIYYKSTKDAFEDYLFRDSYGVVTEKPVNIDKLQKLGADISINYQPLPFFSISGEISYYRLSKDGSYESVDLSSSSDKWTSRFRAKIKMLDGINFSASFDYRGGIKSAQTTYLPSYLLSFGMNSQLLDDRITIGLRAFNVLDSKVQRSIVNTETLYINRSMSRNGRRYGISILYKFNQKKRQRMRSQHRENR